MGLAVVVVDPNENCPAAQVGAKQVIAPFDDPIALKKLAEQTDVMTIEIEHTNSDVLARLKEQGFLVQPAPDSLATIQDKLAQKQFLTASGVRVADFREINDRQSALQALEQFGGQMLIKTRRGGYDGRGNRLVKNFQEIETALENFKYQPLYAEQFISFAKELAVMVARDKDGHIATYPVVETIHSRNICETVLAPAPIDEKLRQGASTMAMNVARHLHGSGVFGIEMFLTDDNQIMVNEIAPRVHNSGHYTIEACSTSQFTQHLLAITGQPLEPTDMKVPAAVTINILGRRNGPVHLSGITQAEKIPGLAVHIYGKAKTKIDRKMGHLTATGNSLVEVRQRAEKARNLIDI